MHARASEFRLFVYGTLMRGHVRHHLIARCPFLGPATTEPAFELVDLHDYPALVQGGGTAVHGELYAVTEEILSRLDRVEGVPDLYRRSEVRLADGSRAQTYVLDREKVAGLPRISSGRWERS